MSWRKKNIITISIFVFLLSWNPQGPFHFQFLNTSFAQSKSPPESVSETTTPKKGFFGKLIDWVKGDNAPAPEGGQETPPPKKEGFIGSFTKKIGNFFGGKEEVPEPIAKTQDPSHQNGIPPVSGPQGPVVDLLTCPSGSLVLEPLEPNYRQSWWPAFLALIESYAKELAGLPKDAEVSRQPVAPASGKSNFERRMVAGTLPHPGDRGWTWNESLQRLVPLIYSCPVFTGIGEGTSGYGALQRDANRVIHPAPQNLFTSNYVVTITSQSDGTRMIDMDPTKVNVFKGTQPGGHGTPSHGARSASDYEVCPGGGECITGRIRRVHCTCKLDPHRYPYDDNSILISNQDPCGIEKFLNPKSRNLIDPDGAVGGFNLVKYPAGVLSQIRDDQGNVISQCDAIDGPVNPHDIKALTCGNFEEYLGEDFQNTYGLQPISSEPVSPPPKKGGSPDGHIDTSKLFEGERQCPPGGISAPDQVAAVMRKIVSSAVLVPDDVIRVSPEMQINTTYLPENRHTFDIYEKGREDKPYGDIMLYNLALVPTLQAISIHLSSELAEGRFGVVTDPLAPGTGANKRVSQEPQYPKAVLGVLYYLDRIIEELNSGRLKLATADLKELGSLSYYYAPGRTVFLDQSLGPALSRVLLLATPHTDDPDINVLANVASVMGPLIHAATHHILLEDDLLIHSNGKPNASSASQYFMSIIPQSSNTSGGGDWTPLPEDEDPCRGLFFNLDRSQCEFETGYLDQETCVPQKVSGGDASKILKGETISRFVSLVSEYYLPLLADTQTKMMCSLGDYIATCTDQVPANQPHGEDFCMRHDPGASLNGVPCTKDQNRAEAHNLVICPDWANDIPDRNRTWVECHYDPRGPDICTINENGILYRCTIAGVSQYPACYVANNVLYDSHGQIAQRYNCERSAPPSTVCHNQACQRLSSEGTCKTDKEDLSRNGILSGLVCDKGSGALLGAPTSGGVVMGLRPENYFTPPQVIHNFLVQGRETEAMEQAGRMVNYRALIPHAPPPPDIMGNIQSLQ